MSLVWTITCLTHYFFIDAPLHMQKNNHLSIFPSAGALWDFPSDLRQI